MGNALASPRDADSRHDAGQMSGRRQAWFHARDKALREHPRRMVRKHKKHPAYANPRMQEHWLSDKEVPEAETGDVPIDIEHVHEEGLVETIHESYEQHKTLYLVGALGLAGAVIFLIYNE